MMEDIHDSYVKQNLLDHLLFIVSLRTKWRTTPPPPPPPPFNEAVAIFDFGVTR